MNVLHGPLHTPRHRRPVPSVSEQLRKGLKIKVGTTGSACFTAGVAGYSWMCSPGCQCVTVRYSVSRLEIVFMQHTATHSNNSTLVHGKGSPFGR